MSPLISECYTFALSRVTGNIYFVTTRLSESSPTLSFHVSSISPFLPCFLLSSDLLIFRSSSLSPLLSPLLSSFADASEYLFHLFPVFFISDMSDTETDERHDSDRISISVSDSVSGAGTDRGRGQGREGGRGGANVIQGTTERTAFSLLLRKSCDIVVPPKGMHQIGVSFAPERLGVFSASVQIRSCKIVSYTI